PRRGAPVGAAVRRPLDRAPANPARGRSVNGPRFRVLVVDDHDVVHWGLRSLLSSQPWVERCLAAHSGDEAVELAKRYSPHGELAGRLFLSPHTVKEHTSSLYRKLGVRNRAEAVQRAQRLGLTA